MAFLSTFIFTFLNLFSFFSLISSTATISSFPSLNQKLGNPYALWRDTNNILYVADQQHVVWKMDSSNIVTAFAGQFGNGGHSGDGGPATSAQLRYPRSMWNDNFNFYVAEEVNNDVRVISLSTGIIHTFAGAGSTYPSTYKSAGNILLASNAAFEAAVAGLWGDSEGNIYVGSALYVYVINSSGYISILAGNPNGSPSSNLATEVKLQNNFFIVGDNLGNIYVSDYWNNVVRKINIATGNSEVIVGQVQVQGYNSWTEGIDGTSFQMNTGLGLWLGPDETLYIADSGSNIVFAYLPATGKLHLVAGQMWSSGGTGRDDSATSYGDGGPATSANIVPYGLSGDTLGNIYIADYFHSAVRVVSSLPVTQSPTASPTIAHQLCSDGGYCDGDTIAIRGYYTGAEDCAAACLQHDSSFEYFDLTTNNQCWCGMSCSSFVSFDTSSYSMNGGWCPTSSPSETPSVAPTISLNPTEFPTEIPSDYPTITPSETPTVTPSLSPTAFPTVNPTTTPTETPTEIPSNSPTDSPSQLPTAAPSLIPTFSPTPEYSLCFSTGYCSGDTQALRGVFTTAGACSAACALVNPDFKYFDLTDSQQCWCGLSCDTVVTFSTRGYRMGGGVCPGGSRKSLRG